MIRFFLYFSLSFLILSIPIKEKPLFYHIDQLATPYTHTAFQRANAFIVDKLSDKTILGMQIIDPPMPGPQRNSKLLATEENRNIKAEELPTKNYIKGEMLEAEYYSESELLELKAILKNSDL